MSAWGGNYQGSQPQNTTSKRHSGNPKILSIIQLGISPSIKKYRQSVGWVLYDQSFTFIIKHELGVIAPITSTNFHYILDFFGVFNFEMRVLKVCSYFFLYFKWVPFKCPIWISNLEETQCWVLCSCHNKSGPPKNSLAFVLSSQQ